MVVAVDLNWLTPFLADSEFDLIGMAQPATVVEPSLGCVEAEKLFAERGISSLAVRDSQGRVGLLGRTRLLSELAGRLGFGRALLTRASIDELVDWEPLLIAAETSLPAAAQSAITRHPEHRYDDVLIERRVMDGASGVSGVSSGVSSGISSGVSSGDGVGGGVGGGLGGGVGVIDGVGGLAVISTARLVQALAGLVAHRSVRDQLTGLATRDLLFHRLGELCDSVRGTSQRVAVVYVDLDDFKKVNDTRGHAVGDQLLTVVAESLHSVARPQDLVGRLGGDEFAIVLPLAAHADCAPIAEQVGRRFLDAVLDTTFGSYGCGASVGIAVSLPGDADPESLLREADMSMYTAKHAGGARVHTAIDVSPALGHGGNGLLAQALREGWLHLYAQPIVATTSLELASIEVLARIHHPSDGILGPGSFLTNASRADRLALDAVVLDQSLKMLGDYERDAGCLATPSLNINLSLESLARPDLSDHVLAVLHHHQIEPHRLRIEVPEIADLHAVQEASSQLRTLREAGVAITLDDLGAGATSLRHMSHLALDGVKIDRFFVAGIATNDRDHAVVEMLISLGLGLGLTVTAEGVETQQQLEVLRRLECPYIQGYLLSRPQPLSRILQETSAREELS